LRAGESTNCLPLGGVAEVEDGVGLGLEEKKEPGGKDVSVRLLA